MNTESSKKLFFIALAAFLSVSAANSETTADPEILYSVTFQVTESGSEMPVGTFFQAEDKNGRVRFSAGIEGGYNTSRQSDPMRMTVSFSDGNSAIKKTVIPPPADVHHGSLFQLRGDIFMENSQDDAAYRLRDDESGWDKVDSDFISDLFCSGNPELCAQLPTCYRQLDVTGVMVRNRYCATVGNRIVWAATDASVFKGLPSDKLAPVHLNDGILVLAYTADPANGAGFLVCAIPAQRKIRDDDCLPSRYGDAADFPYAIIDNRDRLFLFSSYGSVRYFDKKAKKIIETRKANTPLDGYKSTSYQIYAALRFNDTILLGGYPLSIVQLLAPDGKITAFAKPLPEVRLYGEVQTFSAFNNTILAGVWPWGQVWSLDPVSLEWRLFDRLFSHPSTSGLSQFDNDNEPYVAKLGTNQFGQRVQSVAKRGNAIYFMTGAKDGYIQDALPKAGFTDAQLNEYGAVHKYEATGQMAFDLPDAIQKGDLFGFEVTANWLRVTRNGRRIASSPVAIGEEFCLANLHLGKGLYGKLIGAKAVFVKAGGKLKCS